MSRNALVTGASRGLGREIVLSLARRGFEVIGLGCREENGALEVIAELKALGCRGIELCGDLGDPETPQKISRQFVDQAGNLDFLVNNAGCFSPCLITNMDEQQWDRQVEVNLSAPFRMMRSCAAALADSRGSIVNVSSLCGFSGAAGAGPYSAAKSGLEALTKAAAIEWGPSSVRVNAVIPGFLHQTDMGRASSENYVDYVLSRSPLEKSADVRSAAELIASLPDMPNVTGQVFSLEGRVGCPSAPAFGAGLQ